MALAAQQAIRVKAALTTRVLIAKFLAMTKLKAIKANAAMAAMVLIAKVSAMVAIVVMEN